MSSLAEVSTPRSSETRFSLKQLLLFVAATCVVLAFLRTPILQELNNAGHSSWPRASPFTAVDVDGDQAWVQFRGARYELVSINGASTKDILASARRRYGYIYRKEKRFIEDLPAVLAGMGFAPQKTVSLVLRDAQGNRVDVAEAPMTAENRSRLYRER